MNPEVDFYFDKAKGWLEEVAEAKADSALR